MMLGQCRTEEHGEQGAAEDTGENGHGNGQRAQRWSDLSLTRPVSAAKCTLAPLRLTASFESAPCRDLVTLATPGRLSPSFVLRSLKSPAWRVVSHSLKE
jgi:hypothetical protein